jgi:hypothetical protein
MIDHAARQNQAERRAYRRALKWIGIMIAALALGGSLLGYIAAGLPGVWGALIGVALAGAGAASTVWSIGKTIGAEATTIATSVFGTWLIKIVVLIATLALLRRHTFFNPYVLFAVLALGTIGAVVIESLAVHRSRMLYVAPKE